MCRGIQGSPFASHFCLLTVSVLTRTWETEWAWVSGVTCLVGSISGSTDCSQWDSQQNYFFWKFPCVTLLHLQVLQDPSWPFLMQEAPGSGSHTLIGHFCSQCERSTAHGLRFTARSELAHELPHVTSAECPQLGQGGLCHRGSRSAEDSRRVFHTAHPQLLKSWNGRPEDIVPYFLFVLLLVMYS